jgi:glycerol uptake facilitator protein
VSGAHINPAVTLALTVKRNFPWAKVLPYMLAQVLGAFVGTAFLLVFVLALTDERNQPPKSNLAPLLIGFAVAAIGMSFGANAGYAINPARDFGPRVLAWLGGWGTVAFPGAHWYLWVPIVGPLIGGVIGAVVYDLFVGDVLRARGVPPAPDVDAFGETVEDRPGGDGELEQHGRTVRDR